MAKQEPLFPEPVPSNDVESHILPVDSIEAALADIEARSSTTTTVLQEILTHGDEHYYVHHWGINE
jgi:hypothetical protein